MLKIWHISLSLINNKTKLIRYIYNQIILETPMVRASAISALGEIGFKEKHWGNNTWVQTGKHCVGGMQGNEIWEIVLLQEGNLKRNPCFLEGQQWGNIGPQARMISTTINLETNKTGRR